MVDDVAAQDAFEVDLRRLGSARDGSGRDQVGEKGGMTKRRGQVDQQDLARELSRQGGRGVDGQCRRAGAALGREEGDDRRPGLGGGLRLDGRGSRQLLVPELVQGDRDLFQVRAKPLEEPVAVQGQEHGVDQAVDARHVTVGGARDRQDDKVPGSPPPGEEHLSLGVGDRLLDLAGSEEHDHVAALAAQAEGVTGGQRHRPHAPGDRSQYAVV